MTFEVDSASDGKYQCLSSDTKSVNASNGSICTETDTGDQYQIWGGVWYKIKSAGVSLFGGSDPNGNLPVVNGNSSNRTEIDANADGYTYYGSATWGSNKTSDAVWSIERKSADGTEFLVSAPNQDWADRTTIDYNNGVA